jgi:beta-galactosidase
MSNVPNSLPSRRFFLQSTAAISATLAFGPSPLTALAQSTTARGEQANSLLLSEHWQFLQDSLSGPWEAWLTDQTNPWTNVTLPHCFNAVDACDPEKPYYQGPGWYRTHLTVTNPFTGGRTLLHFEGAGQETEVYIDQKLVQRHVGGYDEFVVDITDLAAPFIAAKKPVPLAVMCTNAHNLTRIPSQMSDFTLYGGLYRHVHLVYVPSASIEMLRIRPILADKGASVEIALRCYIPHTAQPKLTADIEVFDSAGKSVFHKNAISVTTPAALSEIASFTLNAPHLWTPDTPSLYRCRVTLHTDDATHTVEERFGCRSFRFEEHGPLFVNGEKLFLRGTHRHQDHAGTAAAVPDDVTRKEMQLVKDMGANFIRLGHYQQSRLVLDLCDELGLVVWEEIPWCRSGVSDETMRAMVHEKLMHMIEQHGNHPSVFFWGLGNEDDWPGEYPSINQPEIRALMQELQEQAHRLDPTRMTSFRRADFIRDIVDVYAPSIWAGWYGGYYTEYQKSLETQRPKQPHMLHIEWGADSHAGRHAEHVPIVEIAKDANTAETGLAFKMTGGGARMSKDGDWSETYACDLFDWHLKVQETLPWFAGSAQWVFKDFTTPLRPENPVPRVNQKGVVARDLTLKESYFVFQSYWAQKPMLHIYGHTWPVRWGKPGEEKWVKIYSNCAEVELFVNGKSAGKRKRNSQDFPAAGLRWNAIFDEGENHLRAVGSNGVVDEITFHYQTAQWSKPTTFQLRQIGTKPGGKWNHITVEAVLADATGTACLDAAHTVRFSLAGDGHLVDNQGTPWGSRIVQLGNGRARITVAIPAGVQSTLAIASDGLRGASISLQG